MREILKLGLILMIVCAVAAGSLAWVYQTTRPIIEGRVVEEFNAALKAVVPEAESFKEVKDEGASLYCGLKGGRVVGVAIPVQGKGYGSSPISMVVGVDPSGRVVQVKVLSHSETAGLGSKITGESFLAQFTGKTPESPVAVGQDIDAISGATISSRGAASGVKKALESFARVRPALQP